MEQLDALADKFEGLPLYFMKFHGGSDVDHVLDPMEYAVYVNDVEHIILDNMQFMLTRSLKGGSGSSFDKFEAQDVRGRSRSFYRFINLNELTLDYNLFTGGLDTLFCNRDFDRFTADCTEVHNVCCGIQQLYHDDKFPNI